MKIYSSKKTDIGGMAICNDLIVIIAYLSVIGLLWLTGYNFRHIIFVI